MRNAEAVSKGGGRTEIGSNIESRFAPAKTKSLRGPGSRQASTTKTKTLRGPGCKAPAGIHN